MWSSMLRSPNHVAATGLDILGIPLAIIVRQPSSDQTIDIGRLFMEIGSSMFIQALI